MTEPYRQVSTLSPRLSKTRLALTLAVGLLGCPAVFAATFGHARIMSSQGAPLVIRVPVSGLGAADAQSLSAQAAPADDWAQAGLTPPVALDSLRVAIEQGARPEGRILRVSSTQPFSGPLADLLLDVRSASGMQRYQVSLITGAHAPAAAPTAAGAGAAAGAAVGAAHTSGARVPTGTIHVSRGDTLFAIARRHAVEGVTIYQMMMALQRTNPQAFIHQNVNLVKAGAQLVVPGMDELLAISDREARRQFQAQAAAFAAMSGRLAGEVTTAPARAEGAAAQGRVSEATPPPAASASAGRGDHLQLSDAQSARQDAAADARTSQRLASADAQGRIGQLEDNVQHLNEALKGQGEAARSAIIDGAKGIGDSIAGVAQAIAEAGKAEEADAARHQSAGQPAGGSAPSAGADTASGSGAAGQPSGGASQGAPGQGPMGGTAGQGPANQGAAGQSTAGQGTTGPEASGASGNPPASGGAAADPLEPTATPEAAARAAQTEAEAAKRSRGVVDWLQEHLLMVMTGLLALIVFIIAWLLRRAGNTRDETYDAAQAAEAKVRETLRDIDLELKPRQDEPRQGESRQDGPAAKS
ncbi:FimV/HubP family polar landmark protein [Castellaniella sp. GW247-6E4]|uniref:FimV/HubP family polar landmark protein n=1 Tax=Castellaniella sp. GW247-6E4 TaxID=3140380 RepID=UPI003314F9E4